MCLKITEKYYVLADTNLRELNRCRDNKSKCEKDYSDCSERIKRYKLTKTREKDDLDHCWRIYHHYPQRKDFDRIDIILRHILTPELRDILAKGATIREAVKEVPDIYLPLEYLSNVGLGRRGWRYIHYFGEEEDYDYI